MKAEGFSASDAEALGVHLQVPRSDIKTMKTDNVGNARGLLYNIIDAWLQQREPTLEELAEALERTDYKKIAKKIRGESAPARPPFLWCNTEDSITYPIIRTRGIAIYIEREGNLFCAVLTKSLSP